MGAWSHQPFGNDTAGDWAYDLVECQDLGYIEATLDNVLDESGYLDASEAEEAIAAIEVLAKVLGKGTQADSYTKEVDVWVASLKQKPSKALLQKAQRVLQRILSKDSELLELWLESEEADAWKSSVNALQSAIQS